MEPRPLAAMIQQESEADAMREGVGEGPAVHAENAAPQTVPRTDPRRDAGTEGEEARLQLCAHGPHAGRGTSKPVRRYRRGSACRSRRRHGLGSIRQGGLLERGMRKKPDSPGRSGRETALMRLLPAQETMTDAGTGSTPGRRRPAARAIQRRRAESWRSLARRKLKTR